MSKSIDVLANEYAESVHLCDVEFLSEKAKVLYMVRHPNDLFEMHECSKAGFKAGYKQRSDELIDLLVELEEYFEKRQDADYEGEETGMVPNKEMQFYSQLKEQIERL